MCYLCRNQRSDCLVKDGQPGTKCPLFSQGGDRRNRCFKPFRGNIQVHFVEQCDKEKLYIKSGYVQPTAQIATSNADSVIDDTEENQLARILAQQIMAAPIVGEESTDAPQSHTQAHATDAADLDQFEKQEG